MNYQLYLESLLETTESINKYLVKDGIEMKNSFEASVDQFYSPMNQEILEKSIQQLNAHKGKSHELIEAPEVERMSERERLAQVRTEK